MSRRSTEASRPTVASSGPWSHPGPGHGAGIAASGIPAWIADVTADANFPRAPHATRAGLHGGYAFPIRLGAEVFSPRLQKLLRYTGKAGAQRWLDIHRTAHGLGIPSNATMLYGHLESYEDRVDHLLRLRALQDETRGFQAFIGLPFLPQHNLLGRGREFTGGADDLKVLAVARLLLDNFDHIKSYWVMIGLKLGAKRFDKWVRRFGFGRPTGVDLPGEEGGIVLRPEHYSGSSMGNMPIGQGIAVTPMQMAAAYTAIANHGVMRPPYIVKGDQPRPRRVLKPRIAQQVSHMLEGVLEQGIEMVTIAALQLAAVAPNPTAVLFPGRRSVEAETLDRFQPLPPVRVRPCGHVVFHVVARGIGEQAADVGVVAHQAALRRFGQ